MKEAETVCSIFKDNYALCNEVNDKVIQHFINCIETHGRHVEYLKFFQTIVKAENQFIRKSQDTIMQEVSFPFSFLLIRLFRIYSKSLSIVGECGRGCTNFL